MSTTGQPWLSLLGDLYRVVARGGDADGRYALIEMIISPGNGPPLHRHSREDEGFCVQDGELTLAVDGASTTLLPGCFAMARRGTAHSFQNTGSGPARALLVISPPGFEAFIEELGTPLPAGSAQPLPVTDADIQKLAETAPNYGVELLA